MGGKKSRSRVGDWKPRSPPYIHHILINQSTNSRSCSLQPCPTAKTTEATQLPRQPPLTTTTTTTTTTASSRPRSRPRSRSRPPRSFNPAPPMATSWPRIGYVVLSLLVSSASASGASDAMIYPGPHPEAFRSLSLGLSLIGPSCLYLADRPRLPTCAPSFTNILLFIYLSIF